MEEQVQSEVVETAEASSAVNTREGMDVSMPDVELASDVPSVQDAVIDEANKRAPNLIDKEGGVSKAIKVFN